MGFLSEIAIRHAYAHFKKPAPIVEEETRLQHPKKPQDNNHLPVQIPPKINITKKATTQIGLTNFLKLNFERF